MTREWTDGKQFAKSQRQHYTPAARASLISMTALIKLYQIYYQV